MSQRFLRRARKGRDAGEVTTTVIMVPVILMAMLLMVQVAIAGYVRHVAAGAAQDGADSAAALNSDGGVVAEEILESSVGSWTSASSASSSRTADAVTVVVSGEVVRVFPFVTFTFEGRGSANVERFVPEGG